MKIRGKITAAISVLGLLFAVTGGVTWYFSHKVETDLVSVDKIATDITKSDIRLVELIKDIQINVIQVQQWLTDISATRGLDGLNDGFDEAKAQADAFSRNIHAALAIARERGMTGVSNTESFESFLIALNGRQMPSLGNLGYHLSFMHQAKGVGNTTDENSVAAAVFTSFDLGGDVAFSPLLEVVHRTGVGGASDTDRLYLTLGGQVDWNGWNVAASWTERETDNPTAADNTDSHFQLSAGYAFDFGLSIDIG
jgi:hypothetical protein